MSDETVQEVADNRGQWFVIHTLSGHENKVRDTILRQIRLGDECGVYDAFIPTEKVTEVRNNKKRVITRKFFPGYILVRMDLYDAEGGIVEKAWSLVRGVQGVLGFLGGASKPTPLTDSEVADLLRPLAAGDNTVKPKINYEVGEVVRVSDGAFANYDGKIQEIDPARGKLKLVMSIFGRPTEVELEFWQVERID